MAAINKLVFVLHALEIFQGGLTAQIQTKQAVLAAAGEQVCLNCQLTVPKEVLQVTWQKVLPDGERNVATFSKYTGQRVNPGFRGKVEFKDAGLQNSSIVIREVTEQDEGCYRCLFNCYPEGALMTSTCLTLYELHGPFLHAKESNTSEETIVSCTATAHPAPTVTIRNMNLKVKSSSDRYHNKNGTVTISAVAVLQRPSEKSTEVECEVQVPSVTPRKVSRMLEVKQPLAYRHEGETESSLQVIGITLAVVVVIVGAVVVLCGVLCLVKQRQCNRGKQNSEGNIDGGVLSKDPENVSTPKHQTRTSLLQQQTSGPRLRSSTKKKGLEKSLKEAGSKLKRQLFGNSPKTPGKI